MTKEQETIYRCGQKMETKVKMIDGIAHKRVRVFAFGRIYIFEFVGGRCVSVKQQ